jgi:hypothetical protein
MKRINLILVVICIILIYTLNIFGQGACPACSNPTLPSVVNADVVLDFIPKGTFQMTLNGFQGFNFQGGHFNGGYLGGGGLTSDGKKIDVPLHTHDVKLDYTKLELNSKYAFKDNWNVLFRLPYEIKSQRASTDFLENITYTDYEKDAIVRNRDIHHRTETYTGLGDVKFLFSHRVIGLLRDIDIIDISLGTSIPVGETEENVLIAGKEGRKHLHIQFGTGTFDPLLEIYYATALSNSFAAGIFTISKFSLYENKNGYRGPAEIISGINAFYKINEWLILRPNLTTLYQGYYYWAGVKDPNSGIFSFMGTFETNIKISKSISFNAGIRYPIYQATFVKNEEGPYKQGPTVLFEISNLFNLE